MEEELPAPKDAISVSRFRAAGSKTGTVTHVCIISPKACILDEELGEKCCSLFHVCVCAAHASHHGCRPYGCHYHQVYNSGVQSLHVFLDGEKRACYIWI